MRDPKRLNDFYVRLRKYHANYFPDWRFGQFMSNFFNWLNLEKKKDPFFPEENQMIKYIEEYCKTVSQWR